MLAGANAAVPGLNPAEVHEMIGEGDVLIVDVRDAPELRFRRQAQRRRHVPRGMLEFRADPESPSHNPGQARPRDTLWLRKIVSLQPESSSRIALRER
jgi:rhodanese-related sulfurtransferase